MSTILAGHFQRQDQADQARLDLIEAGFPEDQISTFFLNQPGQHDLHEFGGDRERSPGAKEIPSAVVQGVASGGAVGVAEAGGENAVEPRKPGMLVAVGLAEPLDQGRVLDVLRTLGANHIERAQGTIVDGDWIDFDPLSAPVPAS